MVVDDGGHLHFVRKMTKKQSVVVVFLYGARRVRFNSFDLVVVMFFRRIADFCFHSRFVFDFVARAPRELRCRGLIFEHNDDALSVAQREYAQSRERVAGGRQEEAYSLLSFASSTPVEE